MTYIGILPFVLGALTVWAMRRWWRARHKVTITIIARQEYIDEAWAKDASRKMNTMPPVVKRKRSDIIRGIK